MGWKPMSQATRSIAPLNSATCGWAFFLVVLVVHPGLNRRAAFRAAVLACAEVVGAGGAEAVAEAVAAFDPWGEEVNR